jgi:hypothetical protein
VSTQIDVTRFAERVERLCDFLLSKMEPGVGGADVNIIHELKSEATRIQFDFNTEALIGLDDYMRGLPTKET